VQQYKGYFVDGTAKMIHPLNPLSYPGGTVLKPGRLGSIIEVARIELPSFPMSMKELAEWFGVEPAKVGVDEYLSSSQDRSLFDVSLQGLPVSSILVCGIDLHP